MDRPFVLSQLPGFIWLPGEMATALPGMYAPKDCRLTTDTNQWPRCLWLYTPDLTDKDTIELIIDQTGVKISEDGQTDADRFVIHHQVWSRVMRKNQYFGPSKVHVLVEFLKELKFFTTIK